MGTWVLVDVSSVAYYYFYGICASFGEFGSGELEGVFYSVLRLVHYLTELFSTDNVVWCFDGGSEARRAFLPSYKEARRLKKSKEELEALRCLEGFLRKVRTEIFPRVGFGNLLWQEGYEGDDQVASVIEWSLDFSKEDCVIVSSDKDLFQLLREGVVQWIPVRSGRVVYDVNRFRKEWGIEPRDWALLKAISGCSSDGVEGVKGVGEKTALRFLKGEMNEDSALYKRIKGSWDVVERNLEIVRLPFRGTNRWSLVRGSVSGSGWDRLLRRRRGRK